MELENQEHIQNLRPKPWAFILIIILAAGLVGVAVFATPSLQKKVGKTGTSQITKRGASAFGTLNFNGSTATDEKAYTAGGTSPQPMATATPSPEQTSSMAPVPYYGPPTYKYTGADIVIPGATGDVFTFDTDSVSPEQDAFARMLGLSRSNLSADNYFLDSLNLVSKDGNKHLTFTQSRWMIDYTNYGSMVYGGAIEAPSNNVTPVSTERALAAAADFVKSNGLSTSGYGSPMVLEPLSSGDSTSTVIYPLTLNGLPVYDTNGQEYGMVMYINEKAEVTTASYPRNLNMLSSTYDLVSSSKTILDYLSTTYGSSGYLGMPVKEGDTTIATQTVSLTTAKNAYVLEYGYASSPTTPPTQYFVPAISFDLPKENQYQIFSRRLVIPTVKSFFDNLNTGVIPPYTTGVPMPADSGSGTIKPL